MKVANGFVETLALFKLEDVFQAEFIFFELRVLVFANGFNHFYLSVRTMSRIGREELKTPTLWMAFVGGIGDEKLTVIPLIV